MGIELGGQALALLLAAAMGAALGVVYDLLRPPRRRSGRLAGAVLDLLFCLAAGAAAFTYAMGAGCGRLGLWELAAALLGFLVYMHTLSIPLLRIFTALLDILYRAAAAMKKTAEKALTLTKKALGRMREYWKKLKERLRKEGPPEQGGENI